MVARFRSISLIVHRLTVFATNLKSADSNESWGFKSPSGHQLNVFRINYIRIYTDDNFVCAQHGLNFDEAIEHDSRLLAGPLSSSGGMLCQFSMGESTHSRGSQPTATFEE